MEVVMCKVNEMKNYSKVEGLLMRLNQAIEDDIASEIAEARQELSKALEELNGDIKLAKYREFDSVLDAIKAGSITIKSIKQIKDSKLFELCDKMIVIDLKEFEESRPEASFVNGQWIHWAQALNHAIYEMVMRELGIKQISPRLQKWKVSAIARELNIVSILKNGELSKNGAKSALQQVLDAIVFIESKDKKGQTVNQFKVDGRDINALLRNYTKWSSNTINGVVFPNDATFRRMLMRIFHRIVTGKDYIAE